MPVPPKISFANTIAKAVPKRTCQRGIVAGRINEMSVHVTMKPSLIERPRTAANTHSTAPAEKRAVARTGKK